MNKLQSLASLIRCRCCDADVVRISDRGEGYYGCYNAKRKSCHNKLLISRKRLEVIILNDLKEKFLTVANLKYLYKNVKKTIAKTFNHDQFIEDHSYYVAHTSIQSLALLEEKSKSYE